jgi:hypothetical protein
MQVIAIQKPEQIGRWCVQALLGFGLATGLYAAQPGLEMKLPESNPNISHFRDDAKIGKDPFFPNTSRRHVTNEVAGETVKMPAMDKIKLQGISGAQENRLAILNNRTFGLGEEAEMKIDGRSVRIRVAEIRARSVLVSINGAQPQEIVLGQRF